MLKAHEIRIKDTPSRVRIEGPYEYKIGVLAGTKPLSWASPVRLRAEG
jgi:hypothetical protein